MCDDCDWEEAAEEAEDVLSMCDEVPERSESFASSVEEKVRSMLEWIEDAEHVTPKMASSISNMHEGISRCLE